MNRNYLSALWKIILVVGFIAACIDYYSVLVYNRSFFPSLGLIMIVILSTAAVVRYYSEK